MRNPFSRFGRAAFAAGLVLAAAAGSVRAADLIPFKMGISAPSVSILPVYLAEAGGFDRKNGLQMEIISAEGGTRGIQVLLSGEIQAMHVGLAPAIQANLQGADLRLIASSVNTLPFAIYGTKPKTPPLPKGSTIGISTFGSETDIAISIALKQMGLLRDDMTISQIGGTTQRFGAMVAGRIDAAPLLEPATTLAKEKGFVPILDLAAAKTPWIFDAVVVTRAYAQAQPETLTRFLKAYIEAALKGLGDEAWAKEVIAKRFKVTDPKVIDATYRDYARILARDLTPSMDGAANVITQLKSVNLPVGSDNPRDYLDLSIIDKLKTEGFVAQMQKQYGVN
jgi:NitT/TauT family transport system substrate-binding protein